jgi:hypothetical protein
MFSMRHIGSFLYSPTVMYMVVIVIISVLEIFLKSVDQIDFTPIKVKYMYLNIINAYNIMYKTVKFE